MRGERDLLRALAALIGLGLATAILAAANDALGGWHRAAAVAALIVLAGLKAEIILARYLALAAAPAWRRGFRAALILLAAILYGSWLIPGLASGWWGAPPPQAAAAANSARE